MLKIVNDTRGIQREINNIQETLRRSLLVTENLIFGYAKENPSAIQACENLSALKEKCECLVLAVRQSGAIAKNIRELEQKIKEAEAESDSLNMSNVNTDNEEMAKQNAELISKLKKVGIEVQ